MTALEKFDFQRAYLTKLKRRPSSKRLQIFKMIGDSRTPCQCTSYSNTVLILVAVLDIHHTAQINCKKEQIRNGKLHFLCSVISVSPVNKSLKNKFTGKMFQTVKFQALIS